MVVVDNVHVIIVQEASCYKVIINPSEQSEIMIAGYFEMPFGKINHVLRNIIGASGNRHAEYGILRPDTDDPVGELNIPATRLPVDPESGRKQIVGLDIGVADFGWIVKGKCSVVEMRPIIIS